MTDLPPLRLREWLLISVIFLVALALRLGYVLESTEWGEKHAAWQVQGPGRIRFHNNEFRAETSDLIGHIRDSNQFRSLAPLADEPEDSAAHSPGFPWLVGLLSRGNWEAAYAVWGVNVLLGALTSVLYLHLMRRAVRSLAVGVIAGLLTAIHPYWLVNCAEIADGALASFLLALCLYLGSRCAELGGPFTSLALGVALAAMALTRAAFLPFALVALLWFLLRCRHLKQGWLCAVLAVLGFANGLAPWTVRNWQTFGEPLPVVSSVWLHLWMGNNVLATGGALDEEALRLSLKPDQLARLLAEKNQASRYEGLARHTWNEIAIHPGDMLNRRLMAGTVFLLGEPWMRDRSLAERVYSTGDEAVAELPSWLGDSLTGLLAGSVLAMLVFGLAGWRRSAHWPRGMILPTLAAVCIPLPYLLGHAGILVGPRLPVDGVWLAFAALGIAGMLGLGPVQWEE